MNPEAFATPPRFFPRVSLPGVDRDKVAALREQRQAGESLRTRYSFAMAVLSKHIYANTITGAKKAVRRKTGKAQRAARKAHR